MNVTGGATDVTTYFQLINVADGTDATGLDVTDVDLSYTRSGDATAAKVDATALAAADSAHADNKMIEVDATDCPGLYRVDWPDAAFAAGVPTVELTLRHDDIQTTTKEVSIDTEVSVTEWNGVKLGTTNPLPNAAPDAAGGFPVSDAGGLDIDTALGVLTGALAELAADPGTTPTLSGAMMLLYMALRNEGTSTSSARTIKNNAGATVLTATLADNGTTFTKGKFA